jgi:hypothetical protein
MQRLEGKEYCLSHAKDAPPGTVFKIVARRATGMGEEVSFDITVADETASRLHLLGRTVEHIPHQVVRVSGGISRMGEETIVKWNLLCIDAPFEIITILADGKTQREHFVPLSIIRS